MYFIDPLRDLMVTTVYIQMGSSRSNGTPGITLKSYTFSKPLDLSRYNGKKKNTR